MMSSLSTWAPRCYCAKVFLPTGHHFSASRSRQAEARERRRTIIPSHTRGAQTSHLKEGQSGLAYRLSAYRFAPYPRTGVIQSWLKDSFRGWPLRLSSSRPQTFCTPKNSNASISLVISSCCTFFGLQCKGIDDSGYALSSWFDSAPSPVNSVIGRECFPCGCWVRQRMVRLCWSETWPSFGDGHQHSDVLLREQPWNHITRVLQQMSRG